MFYSGHYTEDTDSAAQATKQKHVLIHELQTFDHLWWCGRGGGDFPAKYAKRSSRRMCLRFLRAQLSISLFRRW